MKLKDPDFNLIHVSFFSVIHIGMAWNFRFPSITSLSMRKKNLNVNPPYMSISQWLGILNLIQYEHLFKKFKGIEVRKFTQSYAVAITFHKCVQF